MTTSISATPKLAGQRMRRETDRFLFGNNHSQIKSNVRTTAAQESRTNGSFASITSAMLGNLPAPAPAIKVLKPYSRFEAILPPRFIGRVSLLLSHPRTRGYAFPSLNIAPVLLLFALTVILPAAQPLDYFVDQRHDLPEFEATHSIQALSPVVQEFTPSIGGLDVIEIWTEDGSFPVTNGGGATLQLWLRDDTTNNALLAASRPLALPDGWNGPARLLFTNIVWLEGAKRYAMELKVLSRDNWLVRSHGDLFPPPYPAGRYFLRGAATERSDMWFRTGVRVPRPDIHLEYPHRLRWLGIPSMSYRVWSSTNLVEWIESGRVLLHTTNFVFTNLVTDTPRSYYRVTQP